MATNIDERIVAAKFDASDFKKGVDKTIKKLDELKKELNLKETGKNIEELAKKTESSTESMGKSLDKLTERFTTFVGMVKQKILSGLADEVAGVFLKMEQSVKSFIKGISSDQVSAGMSKYEQMLSSVRTMMAAGESEGSAYEAIGKLRDYSDQTSYSLSQMTDALSKLRAAGVDLDTAQRSVEGIANACANAGINATDAQRAFFNLSQAYSSGVLKYTDYRSLELLNMTTEKFKENILEAAVSAGTLKKTSEGVYQTINKNNKKVTAGKKVTKQNLQDMLRYNFVTSDVMNELFGGTFFFDEQKFKEYKKKYKDLDEAIAAAKKDYGDTAVNAYLAAREARSFTDVINTLKDVVSTGWSTTFEHLFGKLEEAKDFFTQLAEGELADVVYKIGEYRNAILGFWDDGVGDTGGGAVFRQTILNISDALGELLKTFLQILPGFDELYKTEEQIEKEGQPALQSLGDKLFMLSMRIRDFSVKIKEAAENFNKFMNEKELDGGKTSRIEKLRQIFANLSAVFGIFAKVVSIAFSAISRAFYVLSPIFDGFLQLLSKITEPLVALKNNSDVFKDVEHSIDNILTILEPVAKVLGDIIGFLGEIGAFIAQMAIDTVTTNIEFFSDALGLLLELFGVNSAQMKDWEGVLANIRKDFEGIKEACKTGLTAVKDFFGALLGDIKKLLGLEDEATEGQKDQNGGVFSGLINFFNTNQFIQDAKAWVDNAIVEVGNFVKSIPERVMKFGANIYDTLRSLFFTDITTHSGTAQTPETKTILTPLGEWVVRAADDIKNWFKDLPNKIVKAVGKIGDWINEVFDYWFGGRTVANDGSSGFIAMENKDGKWVEAETVTLTSRFDSFILDVRKAVLDWFNDLPNKIEKAFKNVGDFISKLAGALNEFLFGKKVLKRVEYEDPNGKKRISVYTKRVKTGFSKWLDSVIKDIKKFIADIPKYIKSGIKGAGDILSSIVGAIFGVPEGKEPTGKDLEDKLKKPFLGIDLNNVLNTIKDIGKEIFNQIARLFTGSEDYTTNAEWFANLVAEGITWIRDKASIALNWVLDFLIDLPDKIVNFFTGEKKDNPERGPIGKAIIGFGEAVGTFISETLPNKILEFINKAIDAIGAIWDKLYKAITGNSDGKPKIEKAVKKASDNLIEASTDTATGGKITTPFEKFIENVGKTIAHIWEKLPEWIAQGIELAIAGIDKVISMAGAWIGDLLNKEEKPKIEKIAEKASSNTIEAMTDTATKGEKEKEPALLTAIKKIAERITNLFVKTIPKAISDAWQTVSGLGSEIFKGFSAIFTGETPESEIAKGVKDFGQMIYDFITKDIPAFIQKAFDFIGKLINGDKDAWKKNIKGGDDVYKQVVAAVESQQRQANERLKKNSEKSGFWSFAESLKESFLNAFQSIGPTILDGIATAIDWIGKVADIVIKALTGEKSISDRVEEAYGKEKPELKSALSRIGESLRKFFLDTIPQFLGSAIGALAANAGEWLSKLFGAFRKATENEEKKQAKEAKEAEDAKPEDVAKSFVELFTSFFNNELFKMGVDAVKAITIVVAIIALLRVLRDLFSLADEAEAVGDVVKWTALAIAFAGIVGILNAVTSLLGSGDEEKVTAAMDFLDSIGKLLEKVSWIVGLMTAGKLIEALSGSHGGGTAAEKLLGVVTGPLTSLFSTVAVAGGASIAGGAVSATLSTMFEDISKSFSDLVFKIDDVVNVIEPISEKLDKMNTPLKNAIDSVNKISELFQAFYTAFGHMYTQASGKGMQREAGTNIYTTDDKQIVNGDTEFTAEIEAFLKNLKTRVELFNVLSVFIEHITASLQKFSTIPDVNAELDSMMGVLTDGKFGEFLTKMLNILRKCLDDSGMSSEKLGVTEYMAGKYTSGLAMGLEILANSLSVFASGISGITIENITAFDKTLDVFERLATTFEGTKANPGMIERFFTGDTTLSAIGAEIKMFGYQMKNFYENIKDIPGFEEGETDKTNRIVSAVLSFAGEIVKVMQMYFGFTGNSLKLFDEVCQKLPTFGEYIAQFYEALNRGFESNGKGLTNERITMLASAAEGASYILQAINGLADLMLIDNNKPDRDLGDILEGIFGTVEPGKISDFNKIASLITAFDKALVKVMETEDFADSYKTIGANIAQKMFEGIQAAFDEDPNLKIQITPVFKLDDDTKAQLKQQLTDAGFEFNAADIMKATQGANSQTDAERITATMFKEQIAGVSSAITDLKNAQTTLNQLTEAFTRMGVYIDKTSLVGSIQEDIGNIADEFIGMRIDQINMGMTPS